MRRTIAVALTALATGAIAAPAQANDICVGEVRADFTFATVLLENGLRDAESNPGPTGS